LRREADLFALCLSLPPHLFLLDDRALDLSTLISSLTLLASIHLPNDPTAAHHDPLRRQLRLRSRLGTATGRPDRNQVVLRPRLVQLRAVGSVPVRWELLSESGKARLLEGKGGVLLFGLRGCVELAPCWPEWVNRRADD
jgi:hypothetical protein